MTELSNDSDIIKVGQYIIIQRQEYTKLHKFSSLTSCASLGKDQVELENIANCKYYTTFKMITKSKGKNRTCSLEAVAETAAQSLKDNLNILESGTDNRNITDDGRSQKLTTDEIVALRESSLSSTDIVGTLISNSNTFNSKTEYSQDKYLKKKEKKYYEFLQIRKPTIRLISDVMYRQDSGKVLGVRSDTLSQILSYSNVNSNGNHLLYDSGTSGLISAAMLNSIGANTEGQLVHMHPGNTSQKQALLAMNFGDEQADRCISVNLYSVLRHYYQSETAEEPTTEVKQLISTDNEAPQNMEAYTTSDVESASRKRKVSGDDEEVACKLIKVNDSTNGQRKQKWELENERASVLLRGKMDSLVIVCKEHPMNIFKYLLPFVGVGKPFVIYSCYQEPLQECYIAMRKLNNVTGVKLTTNWMRGYQVLPDRTHPDVMMQANSGFLLTGWIVQ